MRQIMNFIDKIIAWEMKPVVDGAVDIIAHAPIHHRVSAEFVTEHISLFSKIRLYQCPVCHKVISG